MNTPKLNSILSSSISRLDPARAGKTADSVQALDFSQLLGERRSQMATPTPGYSAGSAGNPAARAMEKSGAEDRNAQVRSESAQARKESSSGSASSRAGRSSGSISSSTEAGSATREGRDTPTQRTSNGNPSVNTAANGSDKAGGTPVAPADGSHTPGATAGESARVSATAIEGGAQSDAELAQQAAEAGLLGPTGVQLVDPALAPAAPSGAGAALQGIAGAPSGVAGTQALTAASIENGPIAGLPSGVPTVGQHQAAEQAGLPTPFAELGAEGELNAAKALLAAAGGRGAFNQAAAAPSTVTPAAGDAATHTQAAAAAALADGIAADTPAPAPLTGHLAIQAFADPSATAAARSLQDFTAMVEAARATSGTSLSAVSGLPPSGASIGPASGLMPFGLPVGQPLGAPAPAAGYISAPLGSAQWPTELGRQFVSMTQGANGVGQVAELRLDPPELGPLRITINLNDGIAQAVFSSPHAAVRQTVENALPQLQQMLEQAGISLGQADVNDQHQAGSSQTDGRQGHQQAGMNGSSGAGSSTTGGMDTHRAQRPSDPNALVDTFA